MKRTLFALLAVGVLATATSPPTQALGECVRPTLEDATSTEATGQANACASATMNDGLDHIGDGITTLSAHVEEQRRTFTKVFFPGYSTECAPASMDTPQARVAVLWDYSEAWDAPLDRAGWGAIALLPPGTSGYTSQLQGHAYVVDYQQGAYTFGLIMHDTGRGEITFNKEHFRDATGYVDTFCRDAGGPPCGGLSHGTSTDEDMRMIVRVVILCQKVPAA